MSKKKRIFAVIFKYNMQFKDIIGQRFLINQFIKAVDSGRISHAQLFLGKMGYGTLALAVAYSQYLLCQNRHHYEIGDEYAELAADSCGECPNCRKIQQLVHSDMYFVFPNTARNTNHKNPRAADFIEDFRNYMAESKFYSTLDGFYRYLSLEAKSSLINVRDSAYVVEKLSMKSYEGGYKILIIWIPEKMNTEAANKLLKTLEEPPEKTLIMLVAERQDSILPTILSRTQKVTVPKIDVPSLEQQMSKDKPSLQPAELEQIAQISEGDYLTARDILDKSEQNRLFTELFVDWMRKLFKLDVSSLSKAIENICKLSREQQKQFLDYVQESFRACFLKNVAGISYGYHLDFGDAKFNDVFPTMITTRNIEKIEKSVTEAQYNILRNAYAKIIFMDLSFTISKMLKNR